jgi:hypothetical protein
LSHKATSHKPALPAAADVADPALLRFLHLGERFPDALPTHARACVATSQHLFTKNAQQPPGNINQTYMDIRSHAERKNHL